jgi:predicted nucleic acid-binding protein
MTPVFADTSYWIALLSPKDELGAEARALNRGTHPFMIVTTDEVIVEVLAHFSDQGPYWRAKATAWVREALQDSNIDVVPQTRDSLLQGLAMYERRPDKEYSVTDCISMATMRDWGLSDVLTNDRHFTQEGFHRLLGHS